MWRADGRFVWGMVMRRIFRYCALFFAALTAQALRAEPLRDFSIAGQQFSFADVIDARALPAIDGGVEVMVTFSEVAAKRIATLTKANVKKPLAIRLDGKVLAQPVVNEPVADGVIHIFGSFAFKEAEAIAKRISGKDPLPDSLDEEL